MLCKVTSITNQDGPNELKNRPLLDRKKGFTIYRQYLQHFQDSFLRRRNEHAMVQR